jgi:hypothetical protein
MGRPPVIATGSAGSPRGECGLIEAGDEAGLAMVLLPQRHVAPVEFSGLPRTALREFVQVLEQGDSGVVLGRRPGIDQGFCLGPGGFRVLGQFIEVL